MEHRSEEKNCQEAASGFHGRTLTLILYPSGGHTNIMGLGFRVMLRVCIEPR